LVQNQALDPILGTSTDTLDCSTGLTIAGSSINYYQDVIFKDDIIIATDPTFGDHVRMRGLSLCGTDSIITETGNITIGETGDLVTLSGSVSTESDLDVGGDLTVDGIFSVNSLDVVNATVSDTLIVENTFKTDMVMPQSGTTVTISDLTTRYIRGETSNLDILSDEINMFGFNQLLMNFNSIGMTATVGITGSLTVTGSVDCTGGSCTSDMRLKKDVRDHNMRDSLNFINELQVLEYQFIDSFTEIHTEAKDKEFVGFNGQQLEELFPQSTRRLENIDSPVEDQLVVKKEELIPHLVSAVQALRKIIDVQQREIQELSFSTSAINTK
jgi:hypothetical protein